MVRAALNNAAFLSFIVSFVCRRTRAESDQVDPHAAFEALGLDSVAVVEMAAEVEDTFAITVDPTVVYDFSTPLSLSNELVRIAREENQ